MLRTKGSDPTANGCMIRAAECDQVALQCKRRCPQRASVLSPVSFAVGSGSARVILDAKILFPHCPGGQPAGGVSQVSARSASLEPQGKSAQIIFRHWHSGSVTSQIPSCSEFGWR